MEDIFIIQNAKVWTAEKGKPEADTIVVKGKKLAFVGRESEMPEQYRGGMSLDVKGKRIIPSLIDSHLHVSALAESTYYYILKNRTSLETILEELRAYADSHPVEEVPYLYATSCPTEFMDAPDVNRRLLDRYVSDRPVLLCDTSFHRCLVNSRMLELMEITPDTPYREESLRTYGRDERGQLTGIVNEHAYEQDIDRMFEKINWYPPNPSDGYVMLPFLSMLNAWGVACVMDGITESEKTLQGIRELKRRGQLHHYYHATVLFRHYENLEEAIAVLRRWQRDYACDYIIIDTLKLFLDGTNEVGTGAVLEPLVNDAAGENYGKLIMPEEELYRTFLVLQKEQLHIQIHLVGDRAFRTVLNAAERAKRTVEERGESFTVRINMLHCELTHPEDRRRPAQLGVHVNWTPHWSGGIFGEEARQYLGEKRFNSMYAFNEMIESGAVVGFSSDVVDREEIERANPFLGMQIGHTRIDVKAGSVPRKPESEKLSIVDLLYGYTYQNAVAIGEEARIGSLKEGKLANFCILNRDILGVSDDEISEIHPEMMMFEGEWIDCHFGGVHKEL